MKHEERRFNAAPRSLNSSRFERYQQQTTPLQRAMQHLATAYTVAIQECDERQLEAFLFAACAKAARESARRQKRAA